MTTTNPLSKDDIYAIRQADRMYAHVRPGDKSTLTAVKNLCGQKRGPFASQAREVQREIAIDASSHDSAPKAFFSISCGQYGRGNMAILAAMLRPGDRIVLHATTNNNGYLDAASIQPGRLENSRDAYERLYVDELLAAVVRVKDGRDRTIASNVLISYSICPDNSARAIRSGSY